MQTPTNDGAWSLLKQLLWVGLAVGAGVGAAAVLTQYAAPGLAAGLGGVAPAPASLPKP